MPFVQTKDLRIHYEIEGPESAPVLVFSNSLGTNLSLWEPQLSAFAKRFRVLRYDFRGHGQTTATSGEYSIELLARDVLQLLDALRVDRVHFCGLSIGGMTAMWLGANAPERIRSLVISNSAPKIGKPETWNERIEMVRKNGTTAISEDVLQRWFTAAFRTTNPAVVAKTKQMIDCTNTDGYIGACAAVRDFDFWSKIASISAPTLVIAGSQDASVPAADVQQMAKQIPGARYAELNAAHISNIEDAGRFTSEVLNFLAT